MYENQGEKKQLSNWDRKKYSGQTLGMRKWFITISPAARQFPAQNLKGKQKMQQKRNICKQKWNLSKRSVNEKKGLGKGNLENSRT